MNHGQGGKPVVNQATHEFQIEVIDEVVGDDTGNHANAWKTRNDHGILVFNGSVNSETGCIHTPRWNRVAFNTFPVLTPNLLDERR